MSIEFQQAIEKKKLLRFNKGKKLVKKELKAAQDFAQGKTILELRIL